MLASCAAARWAGASAGPDVAGKSWTGCSPEPDAEAGTSDVTVAGSASFMVHRACTGPGASCGADDEVPSDVAPARGDAPLGVTDGRSGRAPTVGSTGDALRDTVAMAEAGVDVFAMAARGSAVGPVAGPAAGGGASPRRRTTGSDGSARAAAGAATVGSGRESAW